MTPHRENNRHITTPHKGVTKKKQLAYPLATIVYLYIACRLDRRFVNHCISTH